MSRIFRLSLALLGLMALAACGGSPPTTLLTSRPVPRQAALVPPIRLNTLDSAAPTLMPTTPATGAPIQTLTVTTVPSDAPTAATMPAAPGTPAPTPNLSSENCIACHTDKPKLEELAVDQTAQSAETKGEG